MILIKIREIETCGIIFRGGMPDYNWETGKADSNNMKSINGISRWPRIHLTNGESYDNGLPKKYDYLQDDLKTLLKDFK